jgi:hypothetical protein
MANATIAAATRAGAAVGSHEPGTTDRSGAAPGAFPVALQLHAGQLEFVARQSGQLVRNSRHQLSGRQPVGLAGRRWIRDERLTTSHV